MRLVVLESPFGTNLDGSRADAETIRWNLRYARTAMGHCLRNGEAPYASHLLYTQENVLDDAVPEERKLGMEAGFAWQAQSEGAVVYTDLGVTVGMAEGIKRAVGKNLPVEFRSLGEPWLRFERQAAVSLIVRDDLPLRVLAVWSPRHKVWSLPGGLVEPGETVEAAQARELEEEAGLLNQKAELVFRGPHGLKVPTGRASVVNIFHVQALGEPREMEEGCPIAWKTVEEFLDGSVWGPFYGRILPVLAHAAFMREGR
jgi:8-oxo-dGTP pyrophosphatase MutT (NUDIX family)